MEHIYLNKQNVSKPKSVKKSTKTEIRNLLSKIEDFKNSKKIGKIILHSLI